MKEPIRWGILGTGWIADEFAQGLQQLPDARLVAVGSRTASSANRFADLFQVPHRHASYQALAEDPDVDVVYVATPNPMHREHTLLCLDAGKPVLCEKPFALNAGEARDMIRLARQKNLFLMEAMWSRFFPAMASVRSLLAEGAIGDVQMLAAELCIQFQYDPADRRYALELGGGALLDLGVYTLSLASMVMGPPGRISAMAHLGQTGVDEQAGIILEYEGGRMSTLYTTLRVDSPVEAVLLGTQGHLRIHSWWIHPSKLTLCLADGATREIEMPYKGNGYQFEALEVMDCLRAGRLESDILPLAETLSIIETMDTIRAQWGLRYPAEDT